MIYKNLLRARTAEKACFSFDATEFGCLPDDCGVFHDYCSGSYWLSEVSRADKYEQLRSGMVCENQSRWTQRSPPDITGTNPPRHPRRRPFHTGYPHPSDHRVADPPPIMVASPGPRLIAGPVPSTIGPYPFPGAIRPPFDAHVCRSPAPAIRTYFHPRAVSRQRRLKLRRCVNLHGRRHL